MINNRNINKKYFNKKNIEGFSRVDKRIFNLELKWILLLIILFYLCILI